MPEPTIPQTSPASPIPVAIVGAGPVGLSLALGLARLGIKSILLEKNPSTSMRSKAPGIHVRTLEIFNQWGISQKILEVGELLQNLELLSANSERGPLLSLDFCEINDEADRPGLLILEQGETERLLLESVIETGLCDVRFSSEVYNLEQNEVGVRLAVRCEEGDYELEAEYVAGCDGASSFVRKAINQPFDGITYSTRPMLADVKIENERDALPWPRIYNERNGLSSMLRLKPGFWRLIRLDTEADSQEEQDNRSDESEVSHEEVYRHVSKLMGEGPMEVVWGSRFRMHRRNSPRFRVGRVLLAGDAAHLHSPTGGQGMNGGIQDAHNLAWKLAGALGGGDVDRLLDSYDVERQEAVVGNISRYTDLVTRVFLQAPLFVRQAAFSVWQTLLSSARVRRMSLQRLTMIGLGYSKSPLLDSSDRRAGERLPNPMLQAQDGGEVRLYNLLPVGPVLLEVCMNNGAYEGSQINNLNGRGMPIESTIRIGPEGYRDLNGTLAKLLNEEQGWILVRPDTHIAWAKKEGKGMEEAAAKALGWG
jgi:2-polyprenyl-6-methoxyphenol hydroxylase-like FAD-dependent oxidoreductase